MPVALLFVIIVVCCGYAVLRPLRLLKGLTGVGLVVPAGLAALAVVCTWLSVIALPPPVRGLAVVLLIALGIAGMLRDRASLLLTARAFAAREKVAVSVMVLSVLVPVLGLGGVFWGVQVPLSPHDGAYHTEITTILRNGQPFSDWYPPALPSTFAAVLQLLPWLDTAQGTFDLGLALAVMAPLVGFGLGLSVWRNAAMASASALFLSLTYLFPYFPQIWSGWPLAASMLLAFGVWSAAIEYVERPTWQWAAFAGGLLGAIVVVHGTELYTLGLISLVLLVCAWPRLDWRRLPAHLGLSVLIAIGCAVPYLPILFHWVGGGGASGLGYEAGQALEDSASSFLGDSTFLVFLGGALGIDTPIRLILAAVGAWTAVRTWQGRSVLGAGGLFLAIALAFALLNSVPLVRGLYAATFPWGMSYRTLIVVAIAQALLAGAGAVVLARAITSRWRARAQQPQSAGRRRVGRATRLLVITWGLLTFWALVFTLSITRVVVGFNDDDAAAMRWLRANAPSNAVVANDSWADAGIWIADKAGLRVVRPRIALDPAVEPLRAQVLDNVAHLERVKDAACALGVQYVYSGAQVSDWDARSFPTLDELRASPSLEEVFKQGEASVFRVRLGC